MKRSQLYSLLIAAGLMTATVAAIVGMRPDNDSAPIVEADEPIGDEMTLVRLAPGKQSVAKITAQPAIRQTLVLTRTIPARFAYDESSHISVRAPTAGVLTSVSVNPGEHVDAGTLIATLRSPEIGAARSLLMQRISELELATTESNWQATVQNGVEQLVGAIRKGQSIEDIKKQLSGSVLGKFRGDLLGKYNSLVLAEQLSGSLEQIQASGAISGKVAREREAQLQEALASLEASLEQATFETEQKRRETAAKTRAAKQSVILARQQLVNLTGQAVPEDFGELVKGDETSLAVLEIHSPIAGTIQERRFTATERVETGAEMFVIADTSRLWVRADLRDRDIASVVVNPGDTIHLSVGSNHDDHITGTVHFLGREIDPLSGTVPLVAVIENKSERYRPGLFARVDVPIGQVDDALVVANSAVIDLDGKSSVFIQQDGGYRPATVEVGSHSGNLIEIRGGIETGDLVVTRGTFTLKSELLLEGEE